MKRVISVFVALTMIVSAFAFASTNASAVDYNPQSALDYAEENWDNGIESFIFGDGVERSRRLIEHDERRMRIKRARQRNFLRFAAGNFDADGVKIMIKICIKPI